MREVADPQHIKRTHVDANSAPLVRDAFFIVDDDRNGCGTLRQWHAAFSVVWVVGQAIRKSATVGFVANCRSNGQGKIPRAWPSENSILIA